MGRKKNKMTVDRNEDKLWIQRMGWKKDDMRFRGKTCCGEKVCFPVKEAPICQPQALPQIPLLQA